VTFLKKLGPLFNIRPEEEQLVLLLLVHSFFVGVAQILLKTSATALFLVSYTSKDVPYVYIGSAIAAPLAGILFSRLGKKFPFKILLYTNLGLLFGALIIFRLGIALFPNFQGLYFGSYVWYYVQDALINLEFWGLAGYLLDMRQSKRLFGLISGGEMLARTLSGFSVPLLTRWLATPDLMLLAAAGIAGCFILVSKIFRSTAFQKPGEKSSQRAAPAVGRTRGLLNSSYIRLMITLSVLALLAYYFVDLMYVSQTRSQLPNREMLASFLGTVEAATSLFALLAGLFLAGPIISKFGVVAGLLSLPILSGCGIAAVALSNSLGTTAFVVFGLMVVTRVVFITFRKTTDKTSSRVLYQPLPTAQRLNAQSLIGSIVEPAASGVAGVALLLLPGNISLLGYTLLGITAAWIGVVLWLGRDYKRMLVQALGQRSLTEFSFSVMDASSLAIVHKGLESPYPGEVIYFLDVLEDTGDPSIETVLRKLVSHPRPEVRLDVLRRIERLNLTSASKRVRDRLNLESSPQVLGAALRTLSALGESNVLDQILPYLDDPEDQVKRGAMVGLLRSGGIEGILAAGEPLIGLYNSPDPQQRKMAAQILGDVGISNFYRPLIKLLQDSDEKVRFVALQAAGRLKNPRLWPLVLNNLSHNGLRTAAAAALQAGGDQALTAIEAEFTRPGQNIDLLIRLAVICGHIRSPQAVALLHTHLDHPDQRVQYSVLQALSSCQYQAASQEHSQITARIRQKVAQITWTMAALEDLPAVGRASLLKNTLERQLERLIEQLFILLSFIYDSEVVKNAWQILYLSRSSGEKRAYAVEAMDLLIAADLKPHLMPLLEDLPQTQRLQRLKALYPQPKLSPEERLRHILETQDELSAWVKVCALWALSELNLSACQPYLQNDTYLPEDQRRYLPDLFAAPTGEKTMLSTIEKVIILKTVSIFSETPDEILAEIAVSLQEEAVKSGANIYKKGSPASDLYIIVEGQVQLLDDDKLIADLRDRDIFSELAILDPQPQPTSALATKDTHLLKLNQHIFDDLMADRNEVSRGIIRVLTRRLSKLLLEHGAVYEQPAEKARDDVMKGIFKNLSNL
jgi:HEAT repeat protein/ATP/ADP translocase